MGCIPMSQTLIKPTTTTILTAGSKDVLLTQTDSTCFVDISLNQDAIQIDSGLENMIAITKQGNVYGRGKNVFGELGLGDNNMRNHWTPILFPCKMKQVSCKFTHSLFLSENGQVYSCGENNNGQLVCI